MNNLESLITKAILVCGHDIDLKTVKYHLSIALASLDKISKENKIKEENEKIKKETETRHQKWWEMIKKNASSNLNSNT